MSRMALYTGEMLSILAAWGDAERYRGTIEKLRDGPGLLHRIDRDRARLLLFLATTTDPALVAVNEDLRTEDVVHDRCVRVPYYLATAYAAAATDEAEAAAYIVARDELCPAGLSITGESYTVEATEAEVLESRLSPETRALLEKIPAPGGGTAMTYVLARIKAGRRLGDLEAQRARIELERSSGGPAGSARDARGSFLRTVRFVEAAVDDEDVPPATRELILRPLREAEVRAARRLKARVTDDGSVGDAATETVEQGDEEPGDPEPAGAMPGETKPSDANAAGNDAAKPDGEPGPAPAATPGSTPS